MKRFGGQRLQVYMSLFELLFNIFTYVLGVCSTRVPPVKVLWTETTSVYATFSSSSSLYCLCFRW